MTSETWAPPSPAPVRFQASQHSIVPAASSPRSARARASGTVSSSQASFVAEKYGWIGNPVSSRTRVSAPAATSSSHRSAVRVSCQTIAFEIGRPVARSQTTIVSRWFVIPTPATRAEIDLRRHIAGASRRWPRGARADRARRGPAGGGADECGQLSLGDATAGISTSAARLEVVPWSDPRSVAVLGASERPGQVGQLDRRRARSEAPHRRDVWLVNRNGGDDPGPRGVPLARRAARGPRARRRLGARRRVRAGDRRIPRGRCPGDSSRSPRGSASRRRRPGAGAARRRACARGRGGPARPQLPWRLRRRRELDLGSNEFTPGSSSGSSPRAATSRSSWACSRPHVRPRLLALRLARQPGRRRAGGAGGGVRAPTEHTR